MIIEVYHLLDTFSTLYCNLLLQAVTKFVDNMSENAVGLESQIRPLPSSMVVASLNENFSSKTPSLYIQPALGKSLRNAETLTSSPGD